MAVPTRMASTSASNQARPANRASIRSSPNDTAVTPMQSRTPGRMPPPAWTILRAALARGMTWPEPIGGGTAVAMAMSGVLLLTGY